MVLRSLLWAQSGLCLKIGWQKMDGLRRPKMETEKREEGQEALASQGPLTCTNHIYGDEKLIHDLISAFSYL